MLLVNGSAEFNSALLCLFSSSAFHFLSLLFALSTLLFHTQPLNLLNLLLKLSGFGFISRDLNNINII